MKIPASPPPWPTLLEKYSGDLGRLISYRLGPEVRGVMRSGFWMAEYLSISSILKQAPSQYTRSYLYTETDGSDATYFLSHQLDVLLKAIAGVHGYIERKQRSQSEAQALLRPGSR